jgi:hypothetical protein
LGFRKEKEMTKENNTSFLAEDVAYIIVETEDESPVTIAQIDNSETPFKTCDGYRVRIGFIANAPCLLEDTDHSRKNLMPDEIKIGHHQVSRNEEGWTQIRYED